ncbi:MAG: glycosyltransferase family 2 protein [Planctomycetota bacterium]
MILVVAMGLAVLLSVGALALTLANLRLYCPSPADATSPESDSDAPLVSVCVPARNEEANIEACVRSLLAGDVERIEVLVYDDQSDDDTPRILERLAAEDHRVRPLAAVPLPEGWNGKQHACWRCAAEARGSMLLFTDADVRFEPDCIRRALAAWRALDDAKGPGGREPEAPLGLVSTFPRQITASLGEALLVPMIFFVLFAYLPMFRMRGTTDPAASAACGQFLLVSRGCYDALGGHTAFKDTMHDGVMMPRAARRAGYRTDLFDGTDLASVRMYAGWTATWRGFAKNAFEGLGSLGLLVALTVMHLLGHALPWLVGLAGVIRGQWADPSPGLVLAGVAIALQVLQRLLLAARFRLPLATAVLHPLGVLAMTAVQWDSLRRHATGTRSWRGRVAGA